MAADHHVWSENWADPAHAQQISDLASGRRGDGSTVVVAIDGPAGSGKSSLAALVSARLSAPIVHMDDLFPGWDGLAAAPALLTAQVLAPLQRSEPAAFRRFDWAADRFAELVPVPPDDYLVVEGCGCSVGVARQYATVRVWLDAEHDERMRRGIARDGDMFAPHWERWARQEQAMYEADRTAAHAHLTFRTGWAPGT